MTSLLRRPRATRPALALATIAVALTATLSGCYSGFRANTNEQSLMNSGNGTQAQIGDIRIENATLVLGPEASGTATLVTTLINQGAAPDSLIGLEIDNKPVYVTPGAGELAAGAAVSFGYNSSSWINSYEFTASVSSYVPVKIQFRDAGIVMLSVLTVPPTNIYEGIAPEPATLPAAS
ncbi:MAG: hypothetical protein EXQ60_04795 [Candidatus Nanopelagicales bacterium]|nr:hypothetical protein [Candidatus Nanopelagicales bacterium]